MAATKMAAPARGLPAAPRAHVQPSWTVRSRGLELVLAGGGGEEGMRREQLLPKQRQSELLLLELLELPSLPPGVPLAARSFVVRCKP